MSSAVQGLVAGDDGVIVVGHLGPALAERGRTTRRPLRSHPDQPSAKQAPSGHSPHPSDERISWSQWTAPV